MFHGSVRPPMRSQLWPAAILSLIVACHGGSHAPPSSQASGSSPAADPVGSARLHPALAVPKVPFDHHPCRSLSSTEETAVGLPANVVGKADSENHVCTYILGGTRYAQIAYVTKRDYDMNSMGNRSTEHQAPAGLPGAFYNQQGILWFAKDGYYVALDGHHDLLGGIAHVLVGKL